jgi:Uma2 family endonuclease
LIAVDAPTELLVVAVAGRAGVRVQNPIELDDATEPQPDIVLVRRPWRGHPTAHPRPGDIYLVIEVADTSRETDLGAKLELYARAGIPEFWIVDLTTDGVLVGRNPGGDRYGSMTRVEPSAFWMWTVCPGCGYPQLRCSRSLAPAAPVSHRCLRLSLCGRCHARLTY